MIFRRCILSLLVLLLAVDAIAQERPKVGLVLGGGGARGAAHVGVLKVIEENNIPIDYIAGTSMGAIVGALYASGYSAAEIESLFQEIDWNDKIGDKGPRSEHSIASRKNDVEFAISMEAGFTDGNVSLPDGFYQGQRLELFLRRLLMDLATEQDFDNFPIPYRAVATDLGTMRPVVLANGDVATAVRASMSVPGIFSPVPYNDTLLADGGLVDNVPADVAREMGADILIVVDVRTPLVPASELTSIKAILNQVVTGMMIDRTDLLLADLSDNDIYMIVDIEDVESADFSAAALAIPMGESAANGVIDKLRTLSMSDSDFTQHIAARAALSTEAPLVTSLSVDYDKEATRTEISSMLEWQVGEPLDVDRVESTLSEIYSNRRFSTIQYELIDTDAGFELRALPVDKSWGPTLFEAAFQLTDDLDGHSSYQLSVDSVTYDVNDAGARWINRGRIGWQTGLLSEYIHPFSRAPNAFIAASAEYDARNINLDVLAARFEIRDRRALAAVEFGYDFSNHSEWRIGYEYGHAHDGFLDNAVYGRSGSSLRISQLTTSFLHDTLDDAAFPSSGLFLDARINYPLQSMGADGEATIYMLDINKPLPVGKGNVLLGMSARWRSEDSVVLQEAFTLGGLTRLSGYNKDELFGRYTGLANAIYYRNLHATDDRSSIYFGGSLEAGGAWMSRDDIDSDSLIVSGSVFAGLDTLIGPVYLAYGYAEGGVNTIYLHMGTAFRGLPRR